MANGAKSLQMERNMTAKSIKTIHAIALVSVFASALLPMSAHAGNADQCVALSAGYQVGNGWRWQTQNRCSHAIFVRTFLGNGETDDTYVHAHSTEQNSCWTNCGGPRRYEAVRR